MDTENATETTTIETETTVTEESTGTENKAVYLQYVQRLLEMAEQMGLTVQSKDNKGWVELTGSNGHRVCVQKAVTKLPVIETTLAPELVGGETPTKPNGRIQARIKATDMTAVAAALKALVDPTNPIAAPKRGKGGEKAIPSLDALLAKAEEGSSEDASA